MPRVLTFALDGAARSAEKWSGVIRSCTGDPPRRRTARRIRAFADRPASEEDRAARDHARFFPVANSPKPF